MKHIINAVSQYQADYPSPDLQPIGSSDEEINALEHRLGSRLAPAHREFLSWMGNDTEGILYCDDWYLDQIEGLTEYLPKLFTENNLPIPNDPFICFYAHQGYAVAWYDVPATSDDPDIFVFGEGDPEHPAPYKWGKFSDWISLNIQSTPFDTIRYREARRNMSPR